MKTVIVNSHSKNTTKRLPSGLKIEWFGDDFIDFSVNLIFETHRFQSIQFSTWLLKLVVFSHAFCNGFLFSSSLTFLCVQNTLCSTQRFREI